MVEFLLRHSPHLSFRPWAHPDPSYHSCSRMMWGWSTLNSQKTDQKEEVLQGSFVKCMEWLAFIDPGVSTWITPSERPEVFGRTYKEWGNFIPEPRWKTFPSREERKKQNALCEGDVNRCATPPLKGCTSPINTSPRLPSSGFPTSNQFFSDATPTTSHLSTPTTRPTAVVLLDASPQQNPPPATSRIEVFVFFFASICCGRSFDSSVMQESGDTYSWSDLCIPRIVRQVTSITTTDDELNLPIWAVLLQHQFSPYIHHPLPSWIRLSRHSTRNLMWWLHMVSVTITTLTYPALSPKKDMPAILQWIFLVLVTGDGKDNTPYDAVYA